MPFSFKPEITPETKDGQAAPAPVPQASFGTTSTTNLMVREEQHGRTFFQVIFLFIFGVVACVAVALVGYHYYLSSQIESKKATLASYESRLGTLPLEDMRRLSNRIKVINQLVKEHPSANVAFRIVEDSVENQIVYNRFELRYNDASKTYALQLAGVAPSYKAVAQQVDTFKRKPYTTYVQSVVVEGLQPDDLGRIGFTLKMPILIAGLLPEGLNLSEGAAERIASSTQVMVGATSTPIIATSTATTTSIKGPTSTSTLIKGPTSTSTPIKGPTGPTTR